MASTGLESLNELTPDCKAIRDLKELMFLDLLKAGSMAEIITVATGVKNGQKVGWVGRFADVGRNRPSCTEDFDTSSIDANEKTWELGRFVVKEKLCADDFEDTVAYDSYIKDGNDIDDLTNTELLDYILLPAIEEALKRAHWRVAWLSQKDADHISGGGEFTNGVDLDLVNIIDGFYQKLEVLAPTGSKQRTPIAANYEATYDDQWTALHQSGVATGIFDDLIYKANYEVRGQQDARIISVQALTDALADDIKKNNKGSELQWESLFDGFLYATMYNTVPVYSVPVLDQLIRQYHDDGTKYIKPYRAVFTSKRNLIYGVNSRSGINLDLKVWYDDNSETVKIVNKEKVGTMIAQDHLFQYAY